LHHNPKENSVTEFFGSILADDKGQGLAEYGLILGLIGVLCIGSVLFLSGKIQGLLNNVGSSI
jgi:Flp pilus assembly pilin Flp